MKKKIFFHADLDAFFAAVEQKDNPQLQGKPVIVGAQPGSRGVVSACSYEARRFGIKSAMPISKAYRKCPNGIFLPVRMKRYIEVSQIVIRILKAYTPDMQQISIDEAFLDMTGTERLLGKPIGVAKQIKKNIKDNVGLLVSIGIAPNKYLAKLASDYAKPDGLLQINEGEQETFLNKLSLKDIWGVGQKTYLRLIELNITSIKMLRSFSQNILCSMLGKATGKYLYKAVRGIDPVFFKVYHPKTRSISNEITFEYDRKDVAGIKKVILELSHQIMFRLIENGDKAKTVTLKLRFNDFTNIHAQFTARHWLCSAEEIYKIACELLKSKWNEKKAIRLIGIGASGLDKSNQPAQLELFEDKAHKNRKVEKAVFNIKKKLSGVKITKARLLEKDD